MFICFKSGKIEATTNLSISENFIRLAFALKYENIKMEWEGKTTHQKVTGFIECQVLSLKKNKNIKKKKQTPKNKNKNKNHPPKITLISQEVFFCFFFLVALVSAWSCQFQAPTIHVFSKWNQWLQSGQRIVSHNTTVRL